MNHLKALIGPVLFNIWLYIVAFGMFSWAFDLIVTAVRHQLFFCK